MLIKEDAVKENNAADKSIRLKSKYNFIKIKI